MTATIDTHGYSVPVSGAISGSGNLNKAGSGTLILGNSNSYTGGTSISQGTLQLASAAAVQNSTVSVNVDNGLQFGPGIGAFNVGGLSGSNALTLSDTSGGRGYARGRRQQRQHHFQRLDRRQRRTGQDRQRDAGFDREQSFTGGLVLDPGIVSITSDAALGAVPGSPSTNITFAANSTLQAGGSFALSASRNIAIGAAARQPLSTRMATRSRSAA